MGIGHKWESQRERKGDVLNEKIPPHRRWGKSAVNESDDTERAQWCFHEWYSREKRPTYIFGEGSEDGHSRSAQSNMQQFGWLAFDVAHNLLGISIYMSEPMACDDARQTHTHILNCRNNFENFMHMMGRQLHDTHICTASEYRMWLCSYSSPILCISYKWTYMIIYVCTANNVPVCLPSACGVFVCYWLTCQWGPLGSRECCPPSNHSSHPAPILRAGPIAKSVCLLFTLSKRSRISFRPLQKSV